MISVTGRALVAALMLGGAVRMLGAQQPAGGTVPPAATPLVAPDSIAPYERPSGTAIRPATYVYQLSLLRNGVATPLGLRTVDVSEANVGGTAAWLIAEQRSGSPVVTTDSLWVSKVDLSPQRWSATIDRAHLGVAFTRDSAFGAVQSYHGRSSFATGVPVGALLTGGMVERVVELLPLRDGYRAAASLVLFDLSTPRVLDAELAVERSERTRIGASDVDCWVVVLRAGVMEERLWVTRNAPRVVRMEQTTSSGQLVSVATQ